MYPFFKAQRIPDIISPAVVSPAVEVIEVMNM